MSSISYVSIFRTPKYLSATDYYKNLIENSYSNVGFEDNIVNARDGNTELYILHSLLYSLSTLHVLRCLSFFLVITLRMKSAHC